MKSRTCVGPACAIVGSFLISGLTLAQQPPPAPDGGEGGRGEGGPPPPPPERIDERGGPSERGPGGPPGGGRPNGPPGRGEMPGRGDAPVRGGFGPGGDGPGEPDGRGGPDAPGGRFGGPGGGADGPVRQFEVMRRYLDVVDRYSRMARDPSAAGIAAVVSAADLLKPRGTDAAIKYFNELLPQVRDPAVQRAIRIQLAELHKTAGQQDQALEQLRTLMTGEPGTGGETPEPPAPEDDDQ